MSEKTYMTKKTRTGNGKLIFGEDESLFSIEHQVTSCTLEPNTNAGDNEEVLSGDTVPGDITVEWTLKGTFIEDLGALNSVSEYFFENAGKTVPFRFSPANASAREFTGQVRLQAVSFGGDVGETPKTEFELAVIGQPKLSTIAGLEPSSS